MTDPVPIARNYTGTERAALRVVSRSEWNEIYREHRGPAWFATGGWWPKRLRAVAAHLESRAAAYRVVADAMEREGCR